MSDLKNCNLQQGDWLIPYHCDEPSRIRTISYQEEPAGRWDCISFQKPFGTFFYPWECEPIPLTEDILRKNGIVLKEVGDHGVLTPPRDRDRFEKWFIHTQWKDTYLYYDRLTKCYCLNGLNGVHFTYVHQLQQALRFAGIDKEIEL